MSLINRQKKVTVLSREINPDNQGAWDGVAANKIWQGREECI